MTRPGVPKDNAIRFAFAANDGALLLSANCPRNTRECSNFHNWTFGVGAGSFHPLDGLRVQRKPAASDVLPLTDRPETSGEFTFSFTFLSARVTINRSNRLIFNRSNYLNSALIPGRPKPKTFFRFFSRINKRLRHVPREASAEREASCHDSCMLQVLKKRDSRPDPETRRPTGSWPRSAAARPPLASSPPVFFRK